MSAFAVVFYPILDLFAVALKIFRQAIYTEKFCCSAVHQFSVYCQLVAAEIFFSAFFAIHKDLSHINKLAAVNAAVMGLQSYRASFCKYAFVLAAVALMEGQAVTRRIGKSYIKELQRHFRRIIAEIEHAYCIISAV